MASANQILGMNARQRQYKSQNSKRSFKIANSKLLAKRVLINAEVPVPQLYGVFSEMEQVREFDFSSITTSFVIKPSGGSGGKGILVIRKPLPDGRWLTINGENMTKEDLILHINDILEGQYSTFGTKHKAFIEERIPLHPKFKKYVPKGTPDIRVIVYNRVPVMAMLRLPTKSSEGLANLHQGAIGVGIDIASGVTLKGVRDGKKIIYVPDTKRKLNGIKIPRWSSVLKIAVEAAIASDLAYSGIDLLLHNDKGPVVIELNASPGLTIQLANNAGLKWRLDRVEGLKIRDADHGVRVGKALFAESFADKVKADEGLTIVRYNEQVGVRKFDKSIYELDAVINSGVYRSQIDKSLAEKLGLLSGENFLWRKRVGKSNQLVIEVVMYLKGRKVKSAISVVDLSRNKYKLIIGRHDLQGFLVDPSYIS